MAKATAVELVTFLVKRRDHALSQFAIHSARKNTGQEIYFKTIASDSALLLAHVTGDEFWTAMANQDARGLKQTVETLDRQRLAATPIWNNEPVLTR